MIPTGRFEIRTRYIGPNEKLPTELNCKGIPFKVGMRKFFAVGHVYTNIGFVPADTLGLTQYEMWLLRQLYSDCTCGVTFEARIGMEFLESLKAE